MFCFIAERSKQNGCGLSITSKNLGSGPELDRVNGNDLRHFCGWKVVFCSFLDYGWTWTEFEKFRTGS